MMYPDVKWDGAVQWVCIGTVGKIIGVPVNIALSFPVKRTIFFSQSYKTLTLL
jgi:hypothetical protein